MTPARITITGFARTLPLGIAGGLVLVLSIAEPGAARQGTPGKQGPDWARLCPAGWRPVAPPVNNKLKCQPAKFVRGSSTDPSAAEAKPELFCPRGWKPAGPPVNRQLRCLPDQLARGGGSDPLIVHIPAKAGAPLDIAIPEQWAKGIEGSPIGTVGGGDKLELASGGAAQQFQLTLSQAAAKANVPMKHGSCGLDCGTHVLSGPGNSNVPFQVGMTCPAGTTVTYLAAGATVVQQADSGQKSFSKNVNLQPFGAQELEKACQAALGGNWALPNNHNNKAPTAGTSLEKTIKVSGRCSGWANTVYKDFQAKLAITCQDQSFHSPVP